MSAESVKVSAKDKSTVNLEIKLTEAFHPVYAEQLQGGTSKTKRNGTFSFHLRNRIRCTWPDSLLTKKHKDNKYYVPIKFGRINFCRINFGKIL